MRTDLACSLLLADDILWQVFGFADATGSATLFAQRLLHAGGANTAGRRRVLLCVSFMRFELVGRGPTGSLRDEYVGVHGLRDLLAVEAPPPPKLEL